MEIIKLIQHINNGYLASANKQEYELRPHIDAAIDRINDEMHTCFPVLSEWATYVNAYNATHINDPDFVALSTTQYTAIPDNYLRNVVAPGAARFFYMKDEEGEVVASDYFRTFESNLANMIRDYMSEVPAQFVKTKGGYLESEYENEDTYRGGLMVHGNIYRL